MKEGTPSGRGGQPSVEVMAATSPLISNNDKCRKVGVCGCATSQEVGCPIWECATSQEGRTSSLAHAKNQTNICPLYCFEL
jgi:hypothetical protein